MKLEEAIQALRNNTTITLDLSDNLIGDAGAELLSKALKANTTITTLDLSGNKIGDAGARSLSEALKWEYHTIITTLDLSGNEIGDAGVVSLSEALKENTTLTILGLRSNDISAAGAGSLSEALKRNTAIITLDLFDNLINDMGAKLLSKALEGNTTLIGLNLMGNYIVGNEGANDIESIKAIIKLNQQAGAAIKVAAMSQSKNATTPVGEADYQQGLQCSNNKQYEQAMKYYQLAADQGNAGAQINLEKLLQAHPELKKISRNPHLLFTLTQENKNSNNTSQDKTNNYK